VKRSLCNEEEMVALAGSSSCPFGPGRFRPMRGWWEASLKKPFAGTEYLGALPAEPASSLFIKPLGRLEVHDLPASKAPVLTLRSPAGEVLWSRLMLPSRANPDGTVETAGLRDMRLQRWRRRGQEILVYFGCDWDWGGLEGGLIYLDRQGNFKHFGVSR
jgi:hypothetical protein